MLFFYEVKILPCHFKTLFTLVFLFLNTCSICTAGTDLTPFPPMIPPGGGGGGDDRDPYDWQKRWVKIGEHTFYVHAEDEQLLQLLSQQLQQMRDAGALIPYGINWGANLYPAEWIPQAIRRLMIRYPNGVTIISASACFIGMMAYCRYGRISGPLSPVLQGAGSATLAHMMFFVNLCPPFLQRPLIVGSIGALATYTICGNVMAHHRSLLQARKTTVLNPQYVLLALPGGQSQMLNSAQNVIMQAQAIEPDDESDGTPYTPIQTLLVIPINYLRHTYYWLTSLFYRRR